MKNYSHDEIRNIAAEAGDEEIISRFQSYIDSGYFGKKTINRPTGKFKPMLAIKTSLEKIKNFPVIGSPKYDGVRGILHPEYGLISRDSKPIPNLHIRAMLEAMDIWNLDGEIITFTNGIQDNFNVTQSKVMTKHGEPIFKYMVFDDFEFPEKPYLERLKNASSKVGRDSIAEITNWFTINDSRQLAHYEEVCARISEGLIARAPNQPYKNGKSTLKEAGILKVKRFMDDEGIIIAINQIENGLPMVGSFVVKWKNVVFNLGNGWTDEEAAEMWRMRSELMGAKVTFSYQGTGTNGAPRFSSFIGIRRDI